MIAYEKVCIKDRPDWIIVVGDVNSTAACAMVGAKLWIPVVHLEAGLRSGDRTMPEEINRLVTDAIADVLWTPSADADENLINEGIPKDKIDLIGNRFRRIAAHFIGKYWFFILRSGETGYTNPAS